MKAPFVWFGGKRRVASWVWDALGDVDNYVEPFAGSLAVLLERPEWHTGTTETVNDADQYLANFWRALQADPEAVAHYADWPVSETDLFARHLWLVNEGRERMVAGMEADPDWYDARIAGWWVWGINSWIGSGWCSGKGPWKRPHLGTAGQGVNRQLPHLGDSGRGVNRKLPHLGDPGRGVNQPDGPKAFTRGGQGAPVNNWHNPSPDKPSLYGYMEALAARLRRVRVCCGDWSRVITDGALSYGNTVGVFFDPPYGDVRMADLYATDDLTIATDVARWCRENENNPRYRIVLCGYEGEHDMPGWEVIAYSASASYQTAAGGGSNKVNRHKERLWLSPSCRGARQGTMWEVGS